MPEGAHSTEHFRTLLEPFLTLPLREPQWDLLDRHYRLLVLWNRRLNLTSITDPATIVKRHFGESLFVAARLRSELGTVADLGSGGGFPGFPVAVANPALEITLIESVGKKAAFLKEISRGVSNVRVLWERFEQVDEQFDWVVSRAVGLKSLRIPLLRKAKRLAYLTSVDRAREIAATLVLSEPKFEPVPWDPSTTLLTGKFHVKRPNDASFT
jgi:16S rRNA (guanine527-N7)-methyltransferase